MVRTSFLTDSKWSLRLFLLTLKKPSNVNLPVGSPDTASAEMTALGPGTTSTGTSCSAHNATRSSPGSEMAGMPASVVSRADEILKNLVKVYGTDEIVPSKSPKLRGRKQASVKDAVEEADKGASMQLSMFQLDDPVLVQIRDQIKGLDIDSLTPLEALNKLNEIKKIAGI